MRRLLLILALLIGGNAFSQNPGYFGRKNMLEVKGVFSSPVAASLYSFFKYDELFEGVSAWSYGAINYGAHLSYGHITGKSTMLSLEFGYDDLSFKSYRYSDQETTDWKINCVNIMPKIEFTTNKKQIPLGVNHQLGIGYYSIHSSSVQTSPNDYWESEFPVPIRGVTLMYALVLRSAISKHFLLNYGARYTYNRTFYRQIYEAINQSAWSDYPYSYKGTFGFAYQDDAQKRYNFVSLELGLTYTF